MAIQGINNLISVADLLFSTEAIDVVAILDEYDQILSGARPVKVSVRQPSRLLEHTIETGQVITDYSVILPLEIEMSVIVQAADYRSTYQEVFQYFQSKQLLTVQLNVGNFVNMVIADIPHEETPEKFDAFSMTIKFKQILVVQSNPSFNSSDPTQANTQAQGQQSPGTATPVVSSPATPTNPSLVNSVTASPTVDYSSVQNLSSSSYTISGVQTQNGVQTITNAAPVSITGAATMTNQNSISSVFGGVPSAGGLGSP